MRSNKEPIQVPANEVTSTALSVSWCIDDCSRVDPQTAGSMLASFILVFGQVFIEVGPSSRHLSHHAAWRPGKQRCPTGPTFERIRKGRNMRGSEVSVGSATLGQPKWVWRRHGGFSGSPGNR